MGVKFITGQDTNEQRPYAQLGHPMVERLHPNETQQGADFRESLRGHACSDAEGC
jgi:hypothetical protein